MNNKIFLDKKAVEEVKEVIGGGSGDVSEYLCTFEQRDFFNNVTFDAEKILQLVKNYGVDTSLKMLDGQGGELTFQLVINPSSNYLYDNNARGTILGFAYCGYRYVVEGHSLTGSFSGEETIEEIIANSSYNFYTHTLNYDVNYYVIYLSVNLGNTYNFSTLVKWQDLIDCIAE